jgi:dihydrofolate reductase
MGRVNFDLMAGKSAIADDPMSKRMTDLPKVVVSSRLREPLAWGNTRVLRLEQFAAFKQESDARIRSIGSLRLVRSLLTLGLVDRLRLAIFPLTVGPDGRERGTWSNAH